MKSTLMLFTVTIFSVLSVLYGIYTYNDSRDKLFQISKFHQHSINGVRSRVTSQDNEVKLSQHTKTDNINYTCLRMHGRKFIKESCLSSRLFDRNDSINTDPTVIETDTLPKDRRLMPEIGNGHIATVIKSDTICMNGLYNGANTTSHRARIPSLLNLVIDSIQPSPGEMKKSYILDMKKGLFRERFISEDVQIEIETFAHRSLSRVMVLTMNIVRTKSSESDLTIRFHTDTGPPSSDIRFSSPQCKDNVCSMSGETIHAEYPDIKPTVPLYIVYSEIHNNIVLPYSLRSLKLYFFSSFGVNKTEAEYNFQTANAMFLNGTILESHIEAWNEVWMTGRIDIEGNYTLARSLYASFYYLLSSLPLKPDEYNWPFMGLSPGGLARGTRDQDYMGHVFWDQDTWMFPSIMLLHSDIGGLIIQSRVDKLKAAKLLAKMRGFPGAVYPWESAYTGLPTSPSETCSTNEIHISADVSFALRQYLFLTNLTSFLENGGGDTLVSLAVFWASRVTLNPVSQLYEILDVMGPDEYHFHVNNSVYINTAAKLALMTGRTAMLRRGHTPPRLWTDIIDHMYIPLDDFNLYHPEYDDYQRGTIVKQADVILLGFPLMAQNPSKIVQQNDLKYYSTVTPSGPAMTWGMFCVNWLEQNNLTLAEEYFNKQFGNIQQPFYVWTENDDGSGAVNFHTGMGGYLQSVLFGYGGFRIQEDILVFNPQLIPSVKSWNITGVDYGDNSFDFVFDQLNMYITLTVSKSTVYVFLFGSGTQEICMLNRTQTFFRQKAALVKPYK